MFLCSLYVQVPCLVTPAFHADDMVAVDVNDLGELFFRSRPALHAAACLRTPASALRKKRRTSTPSVVVVVQLLHRIFVASES